MLWFTILVYEAGIEANWILGLSFIFGKWVEMADVYIYLGCLAQLCVYLGIYYLVTRRFMLDGLLMPLRAFTFYLCAAPIIGLLSTEIITPYSMTILSIALVADFFVAVY